MILTQAHLHSTQILWRYPIGRRTSQTKPTTTWIDQDLRILMRKYISRKSRVFGVKFLTQIFVCVKHLTFRNSAHDPPVGGPFWIIHDLVANNDTTFAYSPLTQVMRGVLCATYPESHSSRHWRAENKLIDPGTILVSDKSVWQWYVILKMWHWRLWHSNS